MIKGELGMGIRAYFVIGVLVGLIAGMALSVIVCASGGFLHKGSEFRNDMHDNFPDAGPLMKVDGYPDAYVALLKSESFFDKVESYGYLVAHRHDSELNEIGTVQFEKIKRGIQARVEGCESLPVVIRRFSGFAKSGEMYTYLRPGPSRTYGRFYFLETCDGDGLLFYLPVKYYR